MTNILLVTLVLTNWVDIPGDFKREGGTNYMRQQQVIQTNVFALEIVLCTNRTLIKSTDSGTNGPVQWNLRSQPTPLPVRTRE